MFETADQLARNLHNHHSCAEGHPDTLLILMIKQQ